MSGTQYSFDDNGPSYNEAQPDPELENFDLGSEGTAMVSRPIAQYAAENRKSSV